MRAVLEEYGGSIVFALLLAGCSGILFYILTIVSERGF